MRWEWGDVWQSVDGNPASGTGSIFAPPLFLIEGPAASTSDPAQSAMQNKKGVRGARISRPPKFI